MIRRYAPAGDGVWSSRQSGSSKYFQVKKEIGIWGIPALNALPIVAVKGHQDRFRPLNRDEKSRLKKFMDRVRAKTGNLTTAPNFSVKAVTCPGAKECKIGCFARQGRYVLDTLNVIKSRWARLEFTNHPDFVETMAAELIKQRWEYYRIHDSGDFYSQAYLDKWLEIIRRVEVAGVPTKFWAYTKSVWMFKTSKTAWKPIPKSLRVVLSMGGTFDGWIDPVRDTHSAIFATFEDLYRAEYADATAAEEVDTMWQREADGSWGPGSHRIGLVYHGEVKDAKRLGNMVVGDVSKVKRMPHKEMVKHSKRWSESYRGFRDPGGAYLRIPGKEYLPAFSRLRRSGLGRANPARDDSPLYPGAHPLSEPDDR